MRLLTLFLLFLLAACGKSAPSQHAASPPMDYYDDDVVYELAREAPARARRDRSPPPPPARQPPAEMDARAEADDQAREPTPARRMVHYNGHARLRVQRVQEAADQLGELVTEAGGRIEHASARRMTVRVPVASFHEVFEAALGLGDVVHRSIDAQDVTDAYTAADLRLQTARATRDRLVELLARAEDEEEKLALLRELQRVTEVIDQLERQTRTLSELASMSRITVEWLPREAVAGRARPGETAELRWIRQLTPFSRPFAEDRRPLRLAVPEGMVALSPTGPFVAESADGTRFWSTRLVNSPRAGAAFWTDAIASRLGPDFASHAEEQVGPWRVIRFVDRSDPAYTWLVGVRVSGNQLHLVEAWFPSPTHEARHGEAIRAVLLADDRTAGGR